MSTQVLAVLEAEGLHDEVSTRQRLSPGAGGCLGDRQISRWPDRQTERQQVEALLPVCLSAWLSACVCV